jgi:hypothetical protein
VAVPLMGAQSQSVRRYDSRSSSEIRLPANTAVARRPEVVLEIDHIHPVSQGGTSEILNLATSCVDCNSGKSDRLLSDDSVVLRQRSQLDDLEERRQQIEMMVEWQRGLQSLDDAGVRAAIDTWHRLVDSTLDFSPDGERYIRNLLNKHGLNDVITAMRAAAAKYIEYDAKGCATEASWITAVDYIGRIARVSERQKSDPYAKEVAYICGILRNRLTYYCNLIQAADDVRTAYSWGVTFDQVKDAARRSRTWTNWRHQISELIDEAREDED